MWTPACGEDESLTYAADPAPSSQQPMVSLDLSAEPADVVLSLSTDRPLHGNSLPAAGSRQPAAKKPTHAPTASVRAKASQLQRKAFGCIPRRVVRLNNSANCVTKGLNTQCPRLSATAAPTPAIAVPTAASGQGAASCQQLLGCAALSRRSTIPAAARRCNCATRQQLRAAGISFNFTTSVLCICTSLACRRPPLLRLSFPRPPPLPLPRCRRSLSCCWPCACPLSWPRSQRARHRPAVPIRSRCGSHTTTAPSSLPCTTRRPCCPTSSHRRTLPAGALCSASPSTPTTSSPASSPPSQLFIVAYALHSGSPILRQDVLVHDIASGRQLRVLTNLTGAVQSSDLAGAVLARSNYHTVDLLDARTGALLHVLDVDKGALLPLAVQMHPTNGHALVLNEAGWQLLEPPTAASSPPRRSSAATSPTRSASTPLPATPTPCAPTRARRTPCSSTTCAPASPAGVRCWAATHR